MNSVARVKKSLRAPIKKLANCVSGLKGRGPGAKRWNRRGRGGPPPHRAAGCREPPTVRSYQADVEKERQLREAANAQKNAQRAAMRAHFRRKYQLSENSKDTNRLRTVGGKPSLPRELSKIIHPEANPKDSSFNLLRAFQGLSVGTATRAERHRSRGSAPAGRGEACKVM
ncbi:complexin-3-like [Takifugu flavidus]|uniref:complexin-3-like n=1 Tax=Takifugu flavidus TaxID=433684 RepID=UPI002544004F|nr:complexin-3-like [Takifugu flavidus]